MAHINDIGVGLYSDISFTLGAGAAAALPATYDSAGFHARFATLDTAAPFAAATGSFARILNVREFPSMGTPPNIVKVPVYGSKQSQQIQGQADAPTMDITINYVPADWAAGALGDYLNDGVTRAFRFALMNAQPPGWASVTTAGAGLGGTAITNVIKNSIFYWTGRMEALLVKPSLTDATTAVLTLSMQSDFYGAYTLDAA